MILSDALRVERPSLWAVQPCLTRKREERACVLACVSVPCVCVRVYGGETLFLDVTVQPSQPLLSNTSLLFRGFHRRPAIRKTRSPNRRPAGAGRRSPTHIRGSWRLSKRLNKSKLNGQFNWLILFKCENKQGNLGVIEKYLS